MLTLGGFSSASCIVPFLHSPVDCLCVTLLTSCGKFQTERGLESRMFGYIVEYIKSYRAGMTAELVKVVRVII